LIETISAAMALFVCCLFAVLLCLRAMSYSAGALAFGLRRPPTPQNFAPSIAAWV
jgi:hypothetical protein